MPIPLTIAAWSSLPWLVHGFSTRLGGVSSCYRGATQSGDLNLGFTAADDPACVLRNRELFLASLVGGAQVRSWSLVTLRQTHSAHSRRVDAAERTDLGKPAVLEGDGLFTNVSGVLLGILTADCVPVLVVDPRRRAVAAFHAGWRGTVQGIVERGVERMVTEFGSEPAELLAAIGPAIGACCYTVGEEVRQRFAARFSYAAALFSPAPSQGLRLDLAEANRLQLLSAGLRDEKITLTEACTSCDTARFFSHRAEEGLTGRMLAVVGIRGG